MNPPKQAQRRQRIRTPRCAPRQLGALLALAWLLPGPGSAAGFEMSEVECEEAAAILRRCCGDLPKGLSCRYRAPSGCGCDSCQDEGELPDIGGSAYSCLAQLSCDEVIDRGVCERLFDPDRRHSICTLAEGS